MPDLTLQAAVSRFGSVAKAKLKNRAASGEPEDQLRAPFEALLADLATLCGFAQGAVVPVGESSLSDLKTRPDYAISVTNALVGFIELKAPGKGADPSKFRDEHDRAQWKKLQAIPNLMYTDGNAFSLWRSGEPVGHVVRLDGDVESSGGELAAPTALLALFEDFLRWQPVPPRTAKQLAVLSARLCRLMRDEVTEQLSRGAPALTSLAADWRRLLFPNASDEHFADGYAQAVTFGLLVARARGLPFDNGLDSVARKLGTTDSLIGTALRLLTDSDVNQRTLKTSLGTLMRVLAVVEWSAVRKGTSDAWLYFYEDFLAEYDNSLRKLTGSYYTPPAVVEAMVRLVNEVLHTRFKQARGIASTNVTVADPAVGTGTYLLGVLRAIASEIETAEGAGAVPAAVNDAVKRLVAFELQLGPYAVAQVRLMAEITELTGVAPTESLRMYVTDTLGNPWVEQENLGAIYAPIAESRRQANRIKREVPITVVIGNPPYKEKARGLGGWVEEGGKNHPAPLRDWMPPPEWGVGTHAKHLRNLYVYFWRWATWKVFDADKGATHGIVCFITVAGFLNGPGFQRMRDYLRRKADEIWVIDCSPEGHQPEVNTRIFQGVQQPVCIEMASRSPSVDEAVPARVRFMALPKAQRDEKFEALVDVTVDHSSWEECSTEWRASFLPAVSGAWASFPALNDFFVYDGSGVMAGRTWVIAPDSQSLVERWNALRAAPPDKKAVWFHPHLRGGKPGDRHVEKKFEKGMPPWPHRTTSVDTDDGDVLAPIRYAFRSLDRQWIIPDYRLINQPNPTLWKTHSQKQVYLTCLTRVSPTSGPALTVAGLIPDLDHYKGSFGGRVFPLWSDAGASETNASPAVLSLLATQFGRAVSGEEVFAYIVALLAHPGYIDRFAEDLAQPGLRVPLTADVALFDRAVELGARVIWLHTYGERYVDAAKGRPAGAPRVKGVAAPVYPRRGAIPADDAHMPETIEYDAGSRRLHIGEGYIDNVDPKVWKYEVSGKQVIKQWFSYRGRDRERPIMGDRRAPSPLGEIQPKHWLPAYTSDLIDLLHVLTELVRLEEEQSALLAEVIAGDLLIPPAASRPTKGARGRRKDSAQVDLL